MFVEAPVRRKNCGSIDALAIPYILSPDDNHLMPLLFALSRGSGDYNQIIKPQTIQGR